MESNQPQELWLVEWSRSNMALLNHNYQDAVRFAEASLNKVMHNQVLSLLDVRATAYEKQGLLSRATEDAIRMIQYVPDSPLGYLRLGSVYMTSGKPVLAADVYRQGLQEMPECRQLGLKRERALLRARARFDIIGNLPLELVYKVVMNMDPDDAWVCLLVSQTWCERVSRCGMRWNSVIVKQKPAPTDKFICDAVPLVADHVQYLQVANPLDRALSTRYLEHLKYGLFTNLGTLSLKGSFFASITPVDLAIALWQVRNTLTVLKLDFGSSQVFPLFSILPSCPSITDLSYATRGELYYDSSNRVTCNSLTNLQLFYGNATYTALCSNLAQCPNLTRLDIKSSSDRPLNYVMGCPIARYCRRLKILGLNYYGNELPMLQDLRHKGSGLLFLGIRFDQHFAFEQAAPHIEYNAPYLHQLDITFAQPEDTRGCNSRLNLLYPKLQTLRYRCDERHFPIGRTSIKTCAENFVAGIIYNSSKLMDVSLLYFTCTDNSILIALETAVHRTVRTLRLNSVCFNDTTTEDRYRNLFSSLDQVRNLDIWNCRFLNDNVLFSLATSLRLRQLKLVGCDLLSTNGLIEFFKQIALQESHSLQLLELDSLTATIDQRMIRYISKMNNLDALTITQCDISVEDIGYLVDIAPFMSLETIGIFHCCPSETLDSWSAAIRRAEKQGVTLIIK
ncbi:hypothetical protein BJV82DRAFT_667599 [Fennellomyces sp. T-0311]|nr:hypothetical protein BJV82DRAFT_667599 [Fennellomyces sp. T-0311]